MNRAGLLIALSLSLAFVVLYLIFPELDLRIGGAFYDAVTRTFPLRSHLVAMIARETAMIIAWAICAPAIVALRGQAGAARQADAAARPHRGVLRDHDDADGGHRHQSHLQDCGAGRGPSRSSSSTASGSSSPGGSRAASVRGTARSSPARRRPRSGPTRRPRSRRRRGGRWPTPARRCSVSPPAACGSPSAAISSAT